MGYPSYLHTYSIPLSKITWQDQASLVASLILSYKSTHCWWDQILAMQWDVQKNAARSGLIYHALTNPFSSTWINTNRKNSIWQLVLGFRYPWVGSPNRWRFRVFRGLLLSHSSFILHHTETDTKFSILPVKDFHSLLFLYFFSLPQGDVVCFGSTL